MANLTKTEKYVADTYAKYFGRAADADKIKEYGLKENGKAEKVSIILKNIIADADAEKADLDTTEFVNNAFQNLFGRNATTKEMNKYSKVVNQGKDLPINSIVKSAAKADNDVYKNKLAVAAKYAELGGKGDLDLSKISKGSLITDIKTVTKLDDLQSKIDALPENSNVPSAFDGKTIMLTASADSGKDFVGTDKNDIIEANGTTLTAFDKIDGAAGIDTLQIRDAAGVMNTTIPVGMEIKNVEKMTVQTAGSFGQVAAAPTPAQAAVKQVDTISFAAMAANDTYDVTYNGVTLTTAITVGATAAEAAGLVAGAINAIAGSTVATVVGDKVVVTAPVAGTPLSYSVGGNVAGTPTINPEILNQVAIEATGATTAAVYDVSGIADLTDVKVTTAVNVNLKAAATTNVDVSGATGAVEVNGGKNVNVTVGATGTNTTIGATTGATGTVTVKDAALGTAEIKVDGGTDVTVTATGSTKDLGISATTGDISVGQDGTPILPTGAVTVSSTGVLTDAGAAGADDVTMGDITIDGGSTVTVTQSAGITDAQKTAALTATTNDTVTQGDISVDTGAAATTTVNVKQDATVGVKAGAAAVAAVAATSTVTFKAMAVNETTIIDGLTFTASKALTAEQAAAAFANLISSDTQANGGVTANGTYTGALTTAWTSGAATGATVVFSAPASIVKPVVGGTAGTAAGSAIATTAATTATLATLATPAVNGKIGVDAGVVTIDDTKTTDTIKTVTIDGYADTSSVTSDALTDLTLKNGDVDAVFTVTNAVASSSLTLNVDNITGAGTSEINLDGSAGKITTLTINATGKDSSFELSAGALKDLTINATAGLNISDTSASYATTALKTVDVNGAGKVNLGVISTATALNSFDASGNTGGVTAEIQTGIGAGALTGTITEYVFSAGNDVVTLSSKDVDTKVTLGAGDDKITLASTTVIADVVATIDGGTGSNTIDMTAAVAQTLSGSDVFEGKISNFQKLSIGITPAAATTINLANMDDIDYVISAGTVASGTLLLDKMANNGTLELTGATDANGAVTVTMANASGNTDTFNIVTKVDAGNIAFAGAVVVANVETINVETTDISPVDTTTGLATIQKATLELTAAAAKTVNVKGNSDIDLDMTGNTAATLIDASKLTGDLKVTAYNSDMTVIGGDGNDTLIVDNTTTPSLMSNVVLTGGKGTDTFDVSGFDANGNPGSAVTITDLTAGETIVFKGSGAEKFVSGKVTLIAESTFTEYVSKAAEIAKAATPAAQDNIAWFQFNNNTFVVQDVDSNGTFSATDIIVKINGVKDLSTASFNATDGTLEIA